jgi:hypothetical protein
MTKDKIIASCALYHIEDILPFYYYHTILEYIMAFSTNFGKLHTFAQEVPLIPIQSGNATLDQSLPVFYDCLDNIVDERFSEQEDNYFKHEPRKSEVVECYTEVFVNNTNNNAQRQNDIDGNEDEMEIIETEGADDEIQDEEEEGLFG